MGVFGVQPSSGRLVEEGEKLSEEKKSTLLC